MQLYWKLWEEAHQCTQKKKILGLKSKQKERAKKLPPNKTKEPNMALTDPLAFVDSYKQDLPLWSLEILGRFSWNHLAPPPQIYNIRELL